MSPHTTRRASEAASMSSTGDSSLREADMHHSHFHDLYDRELEPCLRSDPEAESVRSHPSSHAEQTLLPRPSTFSGTPVRAQTQRLQRRRNQYYYSNGLLVPVPAGATTATRLSAQHPGHASPPAPAFQQTVAASAKKAKPYLPTSGSAPSWLLGSTGAFADAKRQSWAGERRESRKLHKEHPARPSSSYEIPADDGNTTSPAEGVTSPERDGGGSHSVLGVRRRMEKLRGLYRRGEKEGMMSSNLR